MKKKLVMDVIIDGELVDQAMVGPQLYCLTEFRLYSTDFFDKLRMHGAKGGVFKIRMEWHKDFHV